ncbi:DNA recombination protein RmuC, partial [Vibrio metoecus]
MQWIFENQSALWSALVSAGATGAAIGWWVKQRYQLKTQLLEQQLEQQSHWHVQQIQQLNEQLTTAQQELDELDALRDKNEFELKQSHGKLIDRK